MNKNLIIIADSLTKVNLATDSSIALCQSAIAKSWNVFWSLSENVHVFGEKIYINEVCQIKTISNLKIDYLSLGKKKYPLNFFNICFVRKDPPFNEEYKDLCWILASQKEVPTINSADTLLTYHEKALQWRAFSEKIINTHNIIPTCLTSSVEIVEEFCNTNKDILTHGIICKPWLGHGGEDVSLLPNKNELLTILNKKQVNKFLKEKVLIQPYLPEIHSEGDRRVIIVKGKVIASFVRFPSRGKIASNLAQGGKPVIKEMSKEQKNICEKLAKFLNEKNICFAGLDLIGNRVGEINITSPTGLKTYESLTGKNIAGKVFQLMVK
ncbi:hypothetical protein [Spirobacillus cienkowskii]|uniref:hypothetical protein n=1 Tax=Spirobacillus cienkowskii TaxID=495820 RepID=UPI0030CF80DA